MGLNDAAYGVSSQVNSLDGLYHVPMAYFNSL
jgi:hypothetical protein